MRDDRQRLPTILRAIGRIEERIPADRRAWDDDEMLQVWMLHHLQIIVEVLRVLSPMFLDHNPNLRGSADLNAQADFLRPMRMIDFDMVWRVITHDISPLRRAVEDVLRETGGEGRTDDSRRTA